LIVLLVILVFDQSCARVLTLMRQPAQNSKHETTTAGQNRSSGVRTGHR
jgi:hypothetical protein